MNKKAASITSIFISSIVVIGIFTGMFLFYYDSLELSGQSMSGNMSETNKSLTIRGVEIANKMDNIQGNLTKVTDTNTGVIGIAVAGVTGIANILTLPITIISTVLAIVHDIIYSIGLPGWMVTTIILLITATILFAAIRAITGRVAEI